jgi:hypothetical protein
MINFKKIWSACAIAVSLGSSVCEGNGTSNLFSSPVQTPNQSQTDVRANPLFDPLAFGCGQSLLPNDVSVIVFTAPLQRDPDANRSSDTASDLQIPTVDPVSELPVEGQGHEEKTSGTGPTIERGGSIIPHEDRSQHFDKQFSFRHRNNRSCCSNLGDCCCGVISLCCRSPKIVKECCCNCWNFSRECVEISGCTLWDCIFPCWACGCFGCLCCKFPAETMSVIGAAGVMLRFV